MSTQDNNEKFPEQEGSAKLHGTYDRSGQKEKYIRDAGKIEDYPDQGEVAKMSTGSDSNPENEGHVKEWQDRARVVLDAKEAVENEASPNQSPVAGEDIEDVEEKSDRLENRSENKEHY